MSNERITQAAYWNGEVGQRWARHQARLDRVFGPLTEALIARAGLAPGQAVLDIGCGAGETSLIAARAVKESCQVLGADLSRPLLDVARARAANGAPVAFLEADAETHDFGAGAYDRILSRFGSMFFADSRAAFANLRRALAPEGRMTLLCWQAMAANPWVTVPRAAVLPLVPEPPPPPPDAPGPFRFADPDALARLLERAGFRAVTCEGVTRLVTLGASPGEAAATATELGPVSHLLREAAPDLRERALAAVTEALDPYLDGGSVRLDAACWLVSAA